MGRYWKTEGVGADSGCRIDIRKNIHNPNTSLLLFMGRDSEKKTIYESGNFENTKARNLINEHDEIKMKINDVTWQLLNGRIL